MQLHLLPGRLGGMCRVKGTWHWAHVSTAVALLLLRASGLVWSSLGCPFSVQLLFFWV